MRNAVAGATLRSHSGLLLACAALALAACDESGASLTIDLRTDLAPGNEFASVRAEVSHTALEGTEGEGELVDDALAISDADYVTGRRVADFSDVAPGAAFVRVTLLDASGEVVVSRVTTAQLRGRVSMVIALTRACRGISCPDPGGDPEATSCVAGRCVPPTCSEATPELCGEPQCATSADCPVTAACARGLCDEGTCFEIGEHFRCASDQWCDADVGCVRRDGMMPDAGSMCPPVEALCSDGDDDDCDGATDCADPDCAGQTCDDGNGCTEDDVCGGDGGVCAGTPIVCADENGCTDDSCDPATGSCVFAPNVASCDDGFFCNGADTCEGGSCAAHEGSPCAQFCSETAGACTMCETATDCGTVSYDAWSACDYSATNTCDEAAQRSRQVTTPSCDAGMCTNTVTTETMACTRDTDGDTGCRAAVFGAWSTGCTMGFSNACDSSGVQERNVTRYACAAGACDGTTTRETRACSRGSRDGVRCGAGATRNRCCGGSCVDIWSSEANCGGCGLRCAGSLSCGIIPGGGGAACHTCSSDTQCPPTSPASAVTCYSAPYGGNGYCNCQTDSACAPGQRCDTGPGDNFCYYP